MALVISNGVQKKPIKVVIYGPEGIGKSTLASKFPDPIFVDTEGSTSTMNVKRVEGINKWEDLCEYLADIVEDETLGKTIVFDTADWAERLCIQYVVNKYGKSGIEDFGYGKGYQYLAEEFSMLIKVADKIIETGRNVVFVAHAQMRKFEQPDEMGAYDRWELKLTKKVAPMLKEWADAVFFLNYKTYVVKDQNGNSKAQGGKRVMYTAHHPCWDAKNRFGLPEECEMDYSVIAPHINDEPDILQPSKLYQLMQDSAVTEDELKQVIIDKKFVDGDFELCDIPAKLRKFLEDNWDKVVGLVDENRKLPF